MKQLLSAADMDITWSVSLPPNVRIKTYGRQMHHPVHVSLH